jgi:hypothetical protein
VKHMDMELLEQGWLLCIIGEEEEDMMKRI